MKVPQVAISFLILCILVSGCMPLESPGPTTSNEKQFRDVNVAMELYRQPDVTEWRVQRDKIAEALGDRVFDKPFARVFDSLTIALGGMGARVATMERQSGFISVTGARSLLPQDQIQQLVHQCYVDYCLANNFDYAHAENIDKQVSPANGYDASMTISLVKQTPKQTKVKVRFAGVYYPPMLEELYKAIWPSLDKQIFMDQGTD